MKTATLLFGLAACASTPSPGSAGSPRVAQYPLCDVDGAPACGNIGQAGRADSAPPRPAFAARAVSTFATAVASTTQVVIPQVTRVLLGASSEMTRVTPFARALVDHREDVACGNVMSKGGSRRVCRDASGNAVSEGGRSGDSDDDSFDE